MNEKTESEKKTLAKSEGKSKATLGDAAGLVPVKAVEELKALLEKAVAEKQAVQIELDAVKKALEGKDSAIAEKVKLLEEAAKTRDLAVKETCEAKSKLLISNKLIESLKADIEKLKEGLHQGREKTKKSRQELLEHAKDAALMRKILRESGLSINDGPLVPEEESEQDEEPAQAEGVTP